MDYIILIVGFILLIKGADLFVDGAAAIARKIGIPAVIVGLTIVSLGTSAPELAVSVTAALKGSNDITMGNVLGSNLFNILLVLGAMALIRPIAINKDLIKKDLVVSLGVTIVLYFLVFTKLVPIGGENFLSRVDGLILIALCITYIGSLVYGVKKSKSKINDKDLDKVIGTEIATDEVKDESINMMKCSLMAIIGVVGIVLGGDLVVNSASNIARTFGLSEKLVGLTIVAVGTSLPELVTSLVAIKKGENEIALGNILGSNIFNILLILGISSFISPIAIAATLSADLLFLIGVTVLIGLLVFMNKEKIKKLNKFEGMLLISLYIGYTIFIIIRN